MSRELKSPSLSIKKLMGFGSFIFRRGFNSSKCKTEAKLATARIKLLRNKREVQVRTMRRDLATLLRSGQDDTARIRVEHAIREQNVMAANEIIELFCELIVVRLPIIAKQRDCPADLKEGISSLIYAAPRCSEIPELQRISEIFEKKYGKDFVSAARDLRPESGVNRLLIEKLSVRKPSGEVKMKIMKEIAKEYQVDWDPTESEKELLKPPEELLEGPHTFVSASSMPVKHALPPDNVQAKETNFRPSNGSEGSTLQFKDMASAAQAAADSAQRAVSAAQAAAYLAKQNSNQQSNSKPVIGSQSFKFASAVDNDFTDDLDDKRILRRNSYAARERHSSIKIDDSDKEFSDELNDKKIPRRNSYAAREVHSDIKFDDSDGLDSDDDEGTGHSTACACSHPPPNRPPPVLPNNSMAAAARVHPKLPDYEALAARFEALKSNRS